MNWKENTRIWLKSLNNDPFIRILIKSSNLTQIQLETLLIDILAENKTGKSLKNEEKARLRLSAVSRGAFNRTLKQARLNVIRSIYTIFLLGYLGVFEDPCLDPYLEVANKLKIYRESYKQATGKESSNDYLEVLNSVYEDLKRTLQHVSKPKTLSRKM